MKRAAYGSLLSAALLALSFPVSPAGAADEIARNGEFYPPAVADYGYLTIWPNSNPGIDQWKVSDGNVDVYSTQLARSPYQAVDLNGGQPGSITQVIRTTPGTTVHLTWKHTRNTYAGCAPVTEQRYNVSIEEAGLQEDHLVRGRIGNWQPAELTFKAQRSRYNLTFASDTTGVCGALISDVEGELIDS
ncbi:MULTISPECIES: DUF642 domain-containing protein [unclassified Streptomyces]|jgi:hypothetical protein|uniref:DUF642 domain-containing protein n=1 Tax=unclassified Streptomyces TaxID=2593676 RepID=UPI0036F9F0E2